MSEKRAGRELVKWVAITLAALVGSYAAAYYVMVETEPPSRKNRPYYSYPTQGWDTYTLTPRPFFAPMHWLDQRLRPSAWNRRR